MKKNLVGVAILLAAALLLPQTVYAETTYDITMSLTAMKWKGAEEQLKAVLKLGEGTAEVPYLAKTGSVINITFPSAKASLPTPFTLSMEGAAGTLFSIDGIILSTSMKFFTHPYDEKSLEVVKGDLLVATIRGYFLTMEVEVPAKGLQAEAIINNEIKEPEVKDAGSKTLYNMQQIPISERVDFRVLLSSKANTTVAEVRGTIYNATRVGTQGPKDVTVSGVLEEARVRLSVIEGASTATLSTDVLKSVDLKPQGKVVSTTEIIVKSRIDVEGGSKVLLKAVDEEGKPINATFFIDFKAGYTKTYYSGETATIMVGEEVQVSAESPGYANQTLEVLITKDTKEVVLTLKNLNPEPVKAASDFLARSVQQITSSPLFITGVIAAAIAVVAVVIFRRK